MRSICLAILFAAMFDLYWKINAEVDASSFVAFRMHRDVQRPQILHGRTHHLKVKIREQ
jgi:hypothetical protein